MKLRLLYTILPWACLAIFIVLVGYAMFGGRSVARIDDIWVVNLDRDIKRWEHMKSSTSHLGTIVNRFSAMDGKTIRDRSVIHKEGVGHYFTKTVGKPSKEIVNKGVVGCWLSHKRLLQHLAKQDRPYNYGHLILEDDVDIPDDFLSDSDAWSTMSKKIPGDWDMVYLGMGVKEKDIPNGNTVTKLTSNSRGKHQYGTHAYLVKHGSIKTKLLPLLRFMTDAIDEQYNTMFDDINAYRIYPSILYPKEEISSKSSILSMN